MFVVVPFGAAQASYVTGGGIVPVCNKGELVPKEVGRDINNNPIIDYQLGPTKCDFTQIINLANSAIDFMLFYIASPIAAIIFCYAGFKMLTSGGSEEAVTHSKKMIMTMIKGYLIALLAWLIIHTIVGGLQLDPNIDTFLSPR